VSPLRWDGLVRVVPERPRAKCGGFLLRTYPERWWHYVAGYLAIGMGMLLTWRGCQ